MNDLPNGFTVQANPVGQSRAKIFLNENRGLLETERSRSYYTFNSAGYYDKSKTPFGNLTQLNDETLAGGHSLKIQATANSLILLLPVVGNLNCKKADGVYYTIQPGKAKLLQAAPGTIFELTNPYEKDLVNFLQFNFDIPSKQVYPDYNTCFDFELDQNQNKFINVLDPFPELPFSFSIGQFDGRTDSIYRKTKQDQDLFVFCLEGAFEVENRLLHARDGLALSNVSQICSESLSNHAILIIFGVNGSLV